MFTSGKGSYCDESWYGTSPDWKGPGWYRLTGAAGTRIPETSPGFQRCGTGVTGWMRGVHPATPGVQTAATICFDDHSGTCYNPLDITVINCGDFYLYNLPETPFCPFRYCGSLVV